MEIKLNTTGISASVFFYCTRALTKKSDLRWPLLISDGVLRDLTRRVGDN